MVAASLEQMRPRRALTARSTSWVRLKSGRKGANPSRPPERSEMSTTDWRCSYFIRTRDFGFIMRVQMKYEHRQSVVDRKSTRLNSSHLVISYAVFCLKKKKKIESTKNG